MENSNKKSTVNGIIVFAPETKNVSPLLENFRWGEYKMMYSPYEI